MKWIIRTKPASPFLRRAEGCIALLLSGVALFGSLSSLGGLGLGPLPWLLGPALLLGLGCLLPQGRLRALLPWAALALALLWTLFRLGPVSEGLKLWCNRVMQASAARQRYEYNLFAADPSLGRPAEAFLPLGLLGAAWYLWSAGRDWMIPLPSALLLLGLAWLGLTPGRLWLCLLLLSSLAPFLLGQEGGFPLWLRLLPLGAALVLTLALPALLPSPNARILALSETLRDELAPRTAAYGETPQETEPPAQETRPYEQEEPLPDQAPAQAPWDPRLLLAIIGSLLLLFVPALWRDRLARRRAENRAGLQDPDPGVRARAGFLYAMRWLRAGGLASVNQAYSAYGPAIEALDPGLGETFQQALPCWQRAAYSGRSPSPEELQCIEAFGREAQAWAEQRLPLGKRLYQRYFVGL